MLEVLQGGLTTDSEDAICAAKYCRRIILDADGMCGLHSKLPNDETMRLLSAEQKLQLMSIPFTGWLPLYPNDLPSGSQWEALSGPVIFSRDALSFLEEVGLVTYESHLLYGDTTTPVFSLTQRGQYVVEDMRTVGLNRDKCFNSLYGHSWDSGIYNKPGRYQGAA